MFDYMFDAPLNDEAYIDYIATVCVCKWEVTDKFFFKGTVTIDDVLVSYCYYLLLISVNHVLV